MLVEKEIIGPATHWYRDQETGLPRKLVVTPELTKYWHDQGNAMLAHGLTVPVPCEHDFNAHPMTPAEKLVNNAGWVKEYRLGTPRKDGTRIADNKLFGVVDVLDPKLAEKLPHTIRWTSPWINSFTDGKGRDWKNVISHLALTTRPRIIDQAPFGSIAAALSMATEPDLLAQAARGGYCLSRAGRLVVDGPHLRPRYPVAFSLFSGAAFGPGDPPPAPPKKKGKPGKPGAPAPGAAAPPDDEGADDLEGGDDAEGGDVDLEPFNDPAGDVTMEEILCDLLGALGINVEHTGGEEQFKRSLYNAAMTKMHELANKGDPAKQPNRTNPPGQPPNNPKPPGAPGQGNPLVPQQEQQPMYMSLEEIQKIPDQTMKTIALSMYNENVRLRAEMEAANRTTASLRDAKLQEATTKRATRVHLLGRLSPRVKSDLDAMLAIPAMALSLGDGGAVVDPMAQTLAVLEKGLGDMPRLLTADPSALMAQEQPTDATMLSEAESDKIADDLARSMGCPPVARAG